MFSAQRAAVLVSFSAAVIISSIFLAGTPAAQEATPRMGVAGKSLFSTYCATCHGQAGKGDGTLASSLRKRPPDLTQLSKSNDGVFPKERIAKAIDGRDASRGDMPGWHEAFSRATQDSDPESVRLKIEALVTYLQSIQERPAAN